MIDRILDLYRDRVAHVMVVVNPASVQDVRRHFDARRERLKIDLVEQPALALRAQQSGRFYHRPAPNEPAFSPLKFPLSRVTLPGTKMASVASGSR